jgi:hypothetical protein
LDAQLRERRKAFARRIEAIDRIQQAAGGLDERLQEIAQLDASITQMESKLTELTGHLLHLPQQAAIASDMAIA